MLDKPAYAKLFLQKNLGPKIIAIARKVHSAGVSITSGDSVLPGSVVKQIGDGSLVLFEEDLRAFVGSVEGLGGYGENPNLQFIKDFLGEISGDVVVNLNINPDENIVVEYVEASVDEDSTKAEYLSDNEIVVEVVEENSSNPIVEHPMIPGLVIQEDGTFWKESWGKL